ncbi:MAG: HYR domain-containing protein, partial [Ignavibacteriae bacterium]|nr:HYR domain-containing protein [Ignavibacteriota bacterium]
NTTVVVTWNTSRTTTGQLYACQVIIEDRDANTNDLRTQVPVDFIIQIIQQSANTTPAFVYPPTPTNNQLFTTNIGANVSFTVQANDTDQGDVVTLNSGGLPAGATMTPNIPTTGNPVSSNFSWTPTTGQEGSYLLNFSATDGGGAQAFSAVSINVLAPGFLVTPTPLNFGTVGVSTSKVESVYVKNTGGALLTVTNDSSDNANFSVSPTSVVNIQPGDSAKYYVTFTPLSTGQKNGNIIFIHGGSTSPDFLPVSGIGGCPAITISGSLPNGDYGVAYNQTLTASGGATPYTFSLSAGTLPTGFTLSSSGVVSGTTSQVGNFSITVTATDNNGCTGSQSYQFSIACPTITLAPASLTGGTLNSSYNETITASGGLSPYTFAVTTGTLPAGLTLSSGGILSGTPTQSGSFPLTITATDANGCTGTKNDTLDIYNPYGSISGMKFEDMNGNGQKDQSEPGLSGWIITITGSVTLSDTTDANGNYSFTNVLEGNFTVSEQNQNGWIQTYPASTHSVTLAGGQSLTGIDFGNKRDCSLSCSADTTLYIAQGCNVSGVTLLSPSVNGPCQIISAVNDAPTSFPLGVTVVNWTVEVTGGAQLTCQQTVTVLDTINPSVSCPANITVNSSNGMCGANVQFSPTANDNCTTVNISSSPASGSFFNVGTTTVTVTATDGSGNQSSCQFTVTVNDTEAPVVTCPANINTTANSQNGTNVSFTVTATDNCNSPVTIVSTPASGSLFPMGTTTVNVTATDSVGNQSLCSFTINVSPAPATISGMKFNDKNGNGVKDAEDTGLQGWVINLTGSATASATTDASGNYSFGNLSVGTYTVREVAQSGWTQTTANPADITVTLGQNVTGVDFGNFQTATVSGMKFQDLDGDGTKDDGETGLQNWTIKATKGASIKNASTAANGSYTFSFSSTESGTWVISETQQNGWTQSAPQGGTYSINVLSGTTMTNQDFGNYQAASISGRKFDDVEGDSIGTGNPSLSGWVIKLFKNGSLSSRQTTDGNGNYSFTNLVPGSYVVQESLKSGWIQTFPKPANAVSPVSETNAGPMAYGVTVNSGSAVTANDFGNFKLGSISGTKYQDTDGDSTIDAGEPALQGWAIQLWNGETLVSVDSSDESGNYSFDGLTAGTYDVSEIQPSDDWYHTIPSTDSYTLTVTSGSNFTGNHFGNVQFGTVSGYKFRDYDSTGTFDEVCEEYLAGQKIVLVGSHTAPETTVTDENGNFTFDPVPADDYTLKEAGDAYWRQTKPANGNPYSFQLLSDEDEDGYVFGNFFILDTTKFRTFTVREYNKSGGARQKSGFAKKPTGGNVRDSVHVNRGFDSPTGYMLAGVERPDSSLIYGWYYYKLDALHPYKANAAKFWLYNNSKLKFDSKKKKQKYPTDYITAYGDNIAESEIGNALNYGQILFLTFKTNIAASDLGITTPGYGELVYACPKNADFSDSVLVGKTLREISHFYDTVLTMGRKIVKISASVSDTTYLYGKSYLRVLDSVMLRLNKEFSQDLSKNLSNAVVDTISTKPLTVKGRKSLYKASYLHSVPEVAFALQRFERKFGQSDVQPLTYRLDQNYPNPFNPMTRIQFELEVPSNVTLKVFNLLGQEIGSLLNNQELGEGLQEIEFDATSLPTGVYFYRLEADGLDAQGVERSFTSVKKMMLVR